MTMVEKGTNMDKVTIYTKPGCPYCAAAKEDLRERGIQYAEHDVKADASALQRMLLLNGNRRHVPTIVQGDRVTVGFSGY
jgi:glutaredoxin 3